MITDRSRFAAGWEEALLARIAAAVRGGVDLLQVRERDLDARTLTRFVQRCVAAAAGTRTRVLVNDRVDVALAAGAHGVHLRSDSMPAPRVRAMTSPAFVVGRSVHSREEAARAAAEGGLDYLLFGTVFATASKPGIAAAGVGTLADVARSTRLPVLAVGGITAARVPAVVDAGAAGFAAIGLFA
jgi:thiamine-phosphate pyrophosphorylase